MHGTTAVKIAQSIEQALRGGMLSPGDLLPPVRTAATALRVSPATVASAYRSLQTRGILVSDGRRGTRISHRQVIRFSTLPALPGHVINLRDGNPDPALLPDMSESLRSIDASPVLYGSPRNDVRLLEIAAQNFAADGICEGPISVVNGAMDGFERLLREHLNPGDRVGMEDPGFGSITDLIVSLGLIPVPVSIDDEGMIPADLERALTSRVEAIIMTPRAQNPTGAAMTPQRIAQLRPILHEHPTVLVIEDDHASLIADTPPVTVVDEHVRRWAVIRSMSKGLNPDLRIALLTGDPDVMTRMEDRLVVGERWVSHVLQRIAAALLSDDSVRSHLRSASLTYRHRRTALMNALGDHGIESHGCSGFNVWIPVAEETPVVQGLLESGWAIRAGERFRTRSSPAIRITASTLLPEQSPPLARALAKVLESRSRTAAA